MRTLPSAEAAVNPTTASDRPAHADMQAIGLDLGGTKLHGGTTTAAGARGGDWLQPTCTTSEDAL